jgi:hypothetical protein
MEQKPGEVRDHLDKDSRCSKAKPNQGKIFERLFGK